MNNSLPESMCARTALVPDLLLENTDSIERQITSALEQARNLFKHIQTATIDPKDAAKQAFEIHSSVNALHDASRYLNERLKLVHEFLSEIESALSETNQ